MIIIGTCGRCQCPKTGGDLICDNDACTLGYTGIPLGNQDDSYEDDIIWWLVR